MMDDRILNTPENGSADLSSLSVDNIERIEIVRGSTSALYGGNAVAGVVNIITKNPSPEPKSSFSSLYGTYQTSITQISDGATIDRFSYLFNGNYKSSQGHRDNSTYYSGDSHLKLTYKFNDKTDLMLDMGKYQDKTESPGARPAKDPAKRKISQKILGNSRVSTKRDFGEDDRSYLNTIFKTGNLKIRNYLNLNDDDNHREWIDALDSNNHYMADAHYRSITYGTEFLTYLDISNERRLTLGVNLEGNRFETEQKTVNVTTGVLASWYSPLVAWDAQRGNYSAYLQNEARFGDVLVTIGGRWDNPTDFKSQFSAKGNLLWHIKPETTLRVSAGDSYRAPSLNDLNWPRDEYAEGNPDLIPEKGKSFEVGLEHTFSKPKLTSGLNLFRQTLTDMIAWAPTGSMGPWGNRWKPDNVNQAWMTGLELGTTCRAIKEITFNLNYTWLDASQRNKEDRCYIYDPITYATLEVIRESETRHLAYTPSHKVDLGASFNHLAGQEDLFLDMGAQYIAPTYQYFIKTDLGFPVEKAWTRTKKLSGYWLANLKLRKSVKKVEFSLGVENLFNKQYAIQFGSDINDRDYPMPGRTILGGLKLEF